MSVSPAYFIKRAGATRAVAIDMRGQLDAGELLTGTPTIVDVDGVLTLGSKVVNTAALTINGRSVGIGQAIQFTVAGGVAGTTYTVVCTCSTGAAPAQVLVVRVKFNVIADSA